MESFEAFVAMVDYSLNSKRKRHIVGGVLMSMSLFFGGLALTAMTLKSEEKEYEE